MGNENVYPVQYNHAHGWPVVAWSWEQGARLALGTTFTQSSAADPAPFLLSSSFGTFARIVVSNPFFTLP